MLGLGLGSVLGLVLGLIIFRDSFSILLRQKALFRANYFFTKELFATSKRKEPFGAVISRKSP